ncbi:MAG TPA: KUP/HAK/KT family potassium transporter [Burkholderiales bacterium]|nr:KUP/HAK/KT family potassium transporter [Burkholderiales bacterium]
MTAIATRGLKTTAGLTVAALGVVYGDIGTSPLYAFKEAFAGTHPLPLSRENILAVLSMMFWAVTLIVSLKYVTLMLRYDHRGEGGVLALLTFAMRSTEKRKRMNVAVITLGAVAASLFYGDAIITPAISVLSAVEGLSVATPRFEHWIVPIAIAVLFTLFIVQRRGPARIGRVFGPVMIFWFLVLATLGSISIAQTPGVLAALNPAYAVTFALERPGLALLALGAVFLCLTGAEALYADMGHFGKLPVRVAWYTLVFPSLMLNYFGQGALVMRDPNAAKNPFFLLAPEPLLLPLVVLATCAAIIASQATISAAYSVTQQASRLNFLPRLRVLHTSDVAQGQIYVPLVNWLMLLGTVSLVLGFGSSSALAGAYGIAVNGDMIISSILLVIVLIYMPGRAKYGVLAAILVFLAIEATFLSSNITKIMAGGWFPLALGSVIFIVLSTWRRGVELLQARRAVQPEAREDNVQLSLSAAVRIPRTGVFFSARRTGYPTAFLHNLKHNMVLHEKTLFVTVEFIDVPYVDDSERLDIERLGEGTWRLIAVFGFREDPDTSRIFKLAARRGIRIDPNTTSFFTSKADVVSVSRPRGLGLRRKLFIWMLQNSPTVADYFQLPPDRVVELRTQMGV